MMIGRGGTGRGNIVIVWFGEVRSHETARGRMIGRDTGRGSDRGLSWFGLVW